MHRLFTLRIMQMCTLCLGKHLERLRVPASSVPRSRARGFTKPFQTLSETSQDNYDPWWEVSHSIRGVKAASPFPLLLPFSHVSKLQGRERKIPGDTYQIGRKNERTARAPSLSRPVVLFSHSHSLSCPALPPIPPPHSFVAAACASTTQKKPRLTSYNARQERGDVKKNLK